MGIGSIYTTYVVHQGADGGVIESVYCGPDYQQARQHALWWVDKECIRGVSILCHDERALRDFHGQTSTHPGGRCQG